MQYPKGGAQIMNLFQNLLQLSDIRSIELAHPIAMSFIANHDINESLSSVYYNEVRSNSYAKYFLSNYSFLDLEQIQEMLLHINMSALSLNWDIEIVEKAKCVSHKTSDEIKEIIPQEIVKKDKTKEVGYNIFRYHEEVFNEEKFNIVYSEFKKVCTCDRDKLLSDYYSSRFLISLLNHNHPELLDKVLEDFGLTINDEVTGSPLYFHLTNNKMLKYIINKNVNTTVMSGDKDFTEHWLHREGGTQLVQEFKSMYKVDSSAMLNSYIKMDKKKEEILTLMDSIDKNNYKIKINGVPVFNKMIEYNNMKMTTYLLATYPIESILAENVGYSPLYYYFVNKEHLTRGVETKKNMLLNKLVQHLDINLISSQELTHIVSCLLPSNVYQHNPINLELENTNETVKKNNKYIASVVTHDRANKLIAYLMQAKIDYEDVKQLLTNYVFGEKIRQEGAFNNLFYISQLMSNSSQEDKNKAASEFLRFTYSIYKNEKNDSVLGGLLAVVDLRPTSLSKSEITQIEAMMIECEKGFEKLNLLEKIEKFRLNLQIKNEALNNKILKI